MSDIVAALRHMNLKPCDEAAAEIERLRAENNSLRWQLTELGQRLQIAIDDAKEWERAARSET